MKKRLAQIFVVSAMLLLVAWLWSLPDSVPPAPAPAHLRVVVANLHYTNRQPVAAAQRLAATQADVVLVLEWTGHNLDVPTLRTAGWHPALQEPRRGTHGLLVLLREGRAGTAARVPAPVRGPCPMPLATLRLNLPGGPVSLLGVHAPPPIPACRETTAPSLHAFAAWVESGKMRQTVGAAQAGDPVILLGDLNTLPWAASLDALADAGLTDAFAATRYRFGPTWSPLGPALGRIDYIFAPPTHPPEQAWTLRLPGSDHRAVVADLTQP